MTDRAEKVTAGLSNNTAEHHCVFCGDTLGGGAGGWFSLVTGMERCYSGFSPTSFHEAAP